MNILRLFILFFLFAAPLSSCGGGSSVQNDAANDPAADPAIDAEDPAVTAVVPLTLTDEEWDETAVRKVLHTFAYGGAAVPDSQIKQWASTPPLEAITAIITFDTANPALSPPENLDNLGALDGTFSGLSALWQSGDAANFYITSRATFNTDVWDSLARTWLAGVGKRGLNPVRFKIGLFETNYHLSLNLNSGVTNLQMLRFYDEITNALALGSSYQQVLATAALSAACATQYNHKDNVFKNARFSGNEDFAREFHQLYFGILGTDDPDYHEITTIRNTAKALTDMTVPTIKNPDGSSVPATGVTFGTEYHYPGELDVLHESVAGATAHDMITALADKAVIHPESQDNLPIIIVRNLADENLTPEKIAGIQALWKSLESKNLLEFIRRYAISKAFHDPTRVKYLSSLDRNVLLSNLMTLNNTESYSGSYDPKYFMESENYYLFRPTHDVFGAQTGLEAATSASVFKEAYNRSIDSYWWFSRTEEKKDNAVLWEKNWASVVPPDADGIYRVKGIAEWLWNHFMADGLKNFGTLERAQVYALIGSGKDFSLFVNPNLPLQVYGKKEIETDTKLAELVHDMEIALVNLDNTDHAKVIEANRRLGLAVAFMSATPYMFAGVGQ